jgi:membrane fusion protein, multidrug efflux system
MLLARFLWTATWAALVAHAALPAAAQAPGRPPPAVTVATVAARDITPQSENIGRIEALSAVDLRARVQGYLQKVNFAEGQQVNQGNLLYVIEPDLYEAAVARAKANLASGQATLREASINLARNQELRKHDTVSQAQLDTAIAQYDTAAANVMAAEADLRTAEINLGYTRVTAPINGRIGKTNFTVGNLVDPSSGPLARLVQLDPIRAVFSVSERDFVSILQQAGTTRLEEVGAQFVPTLRLPNGTDYPSPGKVEFADNQVDANTGTIAIRALFANQQGILLPGETVNVVVRRAEAKLLPVVPVAAVQETGAGKFVLVVDADNRIEQRVVKPGPQVGQDLAIEEGLKPGERIVVDGLQKVQPGMAVTPAPAAGQN